MHKPWGTGWSIYTCLQEASVFLHQLNWKNVCGDTVRRRSVWLPPQPSAGYPGSLTAKANCISFLIAKTFLLPASTQPAFFLSPLKYPSLWVILSTEFRAKFSPSYPAFYLKKTMSIRSANRETNRNALGATAGPEWSPKGCGWHLLRNQDSFFGPHIWMYQRTQRCTWVSRQDSCL